VALSPFVSYLRVSTDAQGRSGLGLAAQRQVGAAYITQAGDEMVAGFWDLGSGKRAVRPQVAAALAPRRVGDCQAGPAGAQRTLPSVCSGGQRRGPIAHRGGGVVAIVHHVQVQGTSSLRTIAAEMHTRGVVLTPAGKVQWSPTQVRRLISRSNAV